MTGAGPSTWARRILTVTTALLLLVSGAATALADPQPGPTQLTAHATTDSEFGVQVSGALADRDGVPIPGAPLQASLNGGDVANGTTTDEGTYTLAFTLPDDSRSGDQQVVVVFGDHNGFDASQAETTVTPAGPPAVSPSPSTTPEDTRLDVFLDVSIAPAIVSAGDLVTIEGAITDQNKAPVGGARIYVLIAGKESKDSLVVSSDSGSFQTFAAMPPGTPSGTTDLVVSFAGDDSYTPGLKRFDVTVDDLPLGEDPASTEDPSASPGTDPSATAHASGTASADVAVTSLSPDTTAGPGPLSWFYVTLIAVGGIAVLVAAALVFRGFYGHTPPLPLEEHDLDSLLRADETSLEEGALLNDTFVDVDADAEPAADSAGTDVTPQEPPTPRRSLD